MKKKVLTVDDSRTMREMVSFTLRGAGFDVVEAIDGQQALVGLASHKVDLILADLNMPNMDGITFVSEARKLPAYKFTPIIMLTTESQEDKKRQAQAAGAKAGVTKPFQPDQMLSAVAKLIAP